MFGSGQPCSEISDLASTVRAPFQSVHHLYICNHAEKAAHIYHATTSVCAPASLCTSSACE